MGIQNVFEHYSGVDFGFDVGEFAVWSKDYLH
jgi:hypothetical protein